MLEALIVERIDKRAVLIEVLIANFDSRKIKAS